MNDPLAYFITFHTYGTWLPGREEGSVDDEHRQYGMPHLPADPEREQVANHNLKHEPFRMTREHAQSVLEAIIQTCKHREWILHAIHVRVTHVHVVVSSIQRAEKVMNDLKAYATRALRDQQLVSSEMKVWSRHGSTRYLWSEDQVAEKVAYTLHEQGNPIARWPEQAQEAAE